MLFEKIITLQCWASQGTGMSLAIPDKDPVSALMELGQSLGLNARIEQASQTGPSHCPT